MPRRALDPSDLDLYDDDETLTVSQVALLLEMDKRAVRALVKAGAFQIQPMGTREMHIFAMSVRAFRQWLDRPSTAA